MAAALTVDLNARIAQFETEMKRATSTLDKFGKRGDETATLLRNTFKTIGGAYLARELVGVAKAGIDAADGFAKMSTRTGIATNDLASFQLAADSADTSMEGVAKGLGKLNRSIGEAENGNKLISASLKQLGITAKDPKEAFYQLADATERIQDPTKRAYLLNNVLGKSYEELVPLLAQGGDALRKQAEASETFAQTMARLAPDAEKFNDNLTELQQNASLAAASILTDLVPAMNAVLENVKQAISLKNSGFGFFQLLGFGVNPTQNPADQLKAVNAELAETEKNLAVISKNKFLDTSEIEKKVADLKRLRGVLIDQVVTGVQKPFDTEALKLIKRNRIGGAGSITAGGSKSAGGSQSDPLSSLLASTDIGKLAAFDKQVALLNARFDGGRKNAELYAQAMTKLVESTFSSNFSDYAKQLAEQDETQRMVAEHMLDTENAINAQKQEWIDAGKAIEEQYKPGLVQLEERLAYLDELFRRNLISAEALSAGYADAFDNVGKSTKKAAEEMDVFAKTAAKNIQNSFADFLFDPFDDGLKSMAQKFGDTIKRMIADAVAADLTRSLFGDLVDGGSGSGVAGGWLKSIGSLFGFANGGIMSSAGPLPLHSYASGGIANTPQLALFGEGRMNEAYVPLPDGRNIPVKMQGGGGHTINVYVNGTSAPDVRRAAGQGAREALGMLEGARRYG